MVYRPDDAEGMTDEELCDNLRCPNYRRDEQVAEGVARILERMGGKRTVKKVRCQVDGKECDLDKKSRSCHATFVNGDWMGKCFDRIEVKE